MADQNKSDTEEKFFSEILSPSELFAARSRSRKIPVRGQKDFFPNDSDEQRRRLQQSLNEHWGLVSEERVERLGNLVKAKWIPSEQMVELQSPAGKFWQTMGFSANGKQRLWPEEALYLMECGNLLVFYRDLPLSIQDGYERFLSSATVSLHQYQVFGHLKRLGYVVHRFDPSSEPTPYVRRLNLPQLRDRAGRQLKRKRSPSPTATPSITQEGGAPAADGMEEDQSSREAEDEDEERPESQTGTSVAHGRTWWIADTLVGRSDPRPASCWHFTPVPFPDLGSGDGLCSTLPPPDPSLLPGALAVGVCDVAAWRQRLDQREEGMEERNVDGEKAVWRCRSWAEYRETVARQQEEELPAHLWGRDVAPLHDPRRPIPTEELLDKLSVIRSTHLLEGASSIQASDEWRLSFSVYQPDSVSDFKKSHPGKPYTRVCVCSFDGPVPDLRAIKLLAFQSRDVPVVFAVVDHGDISFYTFKDFQLPRDVFP